MVQIEIINYDQEEPKVNNLKDLKGGTIYNNL
jgi:hypothetical protein